MIIKIVCICSLEIIHHIEENNSFVCFVFVPASFRVEIISRKVFGGKEEKGKKSK
jgi:hypothetical protein